MPASVLAAKKPDTRTAALVAALHAVSPDPLGGRLGYDVTAARTPVLTTDTERSAVTAQASRDEVDRQAYVVWKRTQKS